MRVECLHHVNATIAMNGVHKGVKFKHDEIIPIKMHPILAYFILKVKAIKKFVRKIIFPNEPQKLQHIWAKGHPTVKVTN